MTDLPNRFHHAHEEPLHEEDWRKSDRRMGIVIWSMMLGAVCLSLGFYFGIQAI